MSTKVHPIAHHHHHHTPSRGYRPALWHLDFMWVPEIQAQIPMDVCQALKWLSCLPHLLLYLNCDCICVLSFLF